MSSFRKCCQARAACQSTSSTALILLVVSCNACAAALVAPAAKVCHALWLSRRPHRSVGTGTCRVHSCSCLLILQESAHDSQYAQLAYSQNASLCTLRLPCTHLTAGNSCIAAWSCDVAEVLGGSRITRAHSVNVCQEATSSHVQACAPTQCLHHHSMHCLALHFLESQPAPSHVHPAAATP